MLNLQCLETIRSPSELNRLLISINELRRADGCAATERIKLSLQELTFHGDFIPFNDLIDLALHFRLIHVHEDSISITPTGQTFLIENPNNLYALTEGQKHLLVQSILFGRTQLSKQFELILGNFSFNVKTGRYEGVSHVTSGRLTALGIRLFCHSIGFLNQAEDKTIYIDPIFNTYIARRIRIFRNPEWDGKAPTDEAIERSKHAEELIYYSEKSRLETIGFHELSRRVQLVSEYNSAAGFDVQSFDGEGSRPEIPDRFIEVKSSIKSGTHFIMTSTELRRAEELRAQYRIVFIGNHDLGKQLKDCYVEEIIDPVVHIFNRNEFRLDAPKFHVIKKGSDMEIFENNNVK